MICYALILLSVGMFGGTFLLNDLYRREWGSGLWASLWLSFIGSTAGAAVLLIVNRFSVTATPFTLLMAFFAAVNSFLFTFCTLKALEHINLSLYSLFTMLGGMLLPFLHGILFRGEDLTPARLLCLILVMAALAATPNQKERSDRRGRLWCVPVFILNGMSGVLSECFAGAPVTWKSDASSGAQASPSDYSLLCALFSAALAAVLLLVFFRKKEKGIPKTLRGTAFGALGGCINRIANLILVFALAQGVDASVQYPMVTGGTMIVSTAVCFLRGDKPCKREIVSVLLAFLGMLALFAVPVISSFFPAFQQFQ